MSEGQQKKSSKKRRSDDKKRLLLPKRLKKLQLVHVAKELVEEKRSNSGRLPHSAMSNAIADLAVLGVSTTRNVLNKAIAVLEAQQRGSLTVSVVLASGDSGQSELSPLTNNSSSSVLSSSTEMHDSPEHWPTETLVGRATAFRNRKATREETAETERRKERRLQRERIKAVTKLRSQKPDISTWNLKDCSAFLQYKKLDGDTAMPSKVVERRQRCQSIVGRPSPCCSPHVSDDDEDDTGGAANILDDEPNSDEAQFQSV